MRFNGTRSGSAALKLRGVRGPHRPMRHQRSGEDGFTLVELLIVVGVTPLIIGALVMGLFSMFSLENSVTNRLTDTGEAQAFQANFRVDIQSAEQITTQSSNTGDECGTGTQLLELEWNENNTTHAYQTIVSYMSVATTSGSTTTYSLVRNYCTTGPSSTPTTSTIISSDLSPSVGANDVSVTCVSGETCNVSQGWVNAQNIENVSFPISETDSSESLTLVADPATNGSATDNGGPITVTTSTGCGYAAPGSGFYATSLCLINFGSLTGNNMLAAEQGCLETSIPLPGGSTMYYCIGITGAPVLPSALPTWTDGFLGNSINGVPFYTDIAGDPALYQDCEGGSSTCTVNGVSGVANTWGGKTTITISGIEVVGPNGSADTGWEFISADAESTDSGESIQWTTNATSPMTVIPNDESVDTTADPIGNACNSGAGVSPQNVLTGSTSTSITCDGYSNGVKTGTMMVEALTPSSMTVTMIGTGLEGVSFGLLF